MYDKYLRLLETWNLKSVVEKRDYEFYRKNYYKKDEIFKVFRNALHVESGVHLTNRIE